MLYLFRRSNLLAKNIWWTSLKRSYSLKIQPHTNLWMFHSYVCSLRKLLFFVKPWIKALGGQLSNFYKKKTCLKKQTKLTKSLSQQELKTQALTLFGILFWKRSNLYLYIYIYIFIFIYIYILLYLYIYTKATKDITGLCQRYTKYRTICFWKTFRNQMKSDVSANTCYFW